MAPSPALAPGCDARAPREVSTVVEAWTDEQLVDAARSGNDAAFAALMRRHYPDCVRFAYRMLSSHADAEDAAQETFVRVHRTLQRYDSRDRFRAWLLHILRNRCRSLAARRWWRQQRLRGWRPIGETPHATYSGVGDAVQAALAVLPARLREAFILKHVEDLTYAEMQTITGASASALKMRVKRACELLETSLRDLI